jgi:hypothetical protein
MSTKISFKIEFQEIIGIVDEIIFNYNTYLNMFLIIPPVPTKGDLKSFLDNFDDIT